MKKTLAEKVWVSVDVITKMGKNCVVGSIDGLVKICIAFK